MMKYYMLVFILMLVSCGSSSSPSVNVTSTTFSTALTPGLFVDGTVYDKLEDVFNTVKECGGFDKGSFSEVTIILMNPIFKCGSTHGDSDCWGLFISPSTILLGDHRAFSHEVVHYLGQVNYNNPYLDHESPLFNTCVPFTGIHITEGHESANSS